MKSLSLMYASSLFALADEENITKKIMDELNTLCAVFSENREYLSLLDSPVISLKERIALADEALFSAHEYTKNFIKILCEKRRAHLFFDCVSHFEKLFNRKHNIEKVTVITAVPLSDVLTEKLRLKLERDFLKKIIIDKKVDKSLIGGIIIRTENSQTDSSVRARLDAVKAQLSSAY